MRPLDRSAETKNRGRHTRRRPVEGRPCPSRVARELAVQVARVKNGLVREYGVAIGGQTQLLEAALREAEAVAWQTPYPHLLFPALAEEKATAVSRWAARQRAVRRNSREIVLSA